MTRYLVPADGRRRPGRGGPDLRRLLKTHETTEQARTGRSRPSKPPAQAENAPTAEAAKAEQAPKIIADWAASPRPAILLISGEQDGYLDPCGCTEGQLGGLGRRYDLLEKLRGQGLAGRPDRPRQPDPLPRRTRGAVRAGEDQVRHRSSRPSRR